MKKIEPLLYEELIAPERRYKILLPEEIPLYPEIFKSDFAYTPQFVDEVCQSLPQSLKEDISQIEKKLGVKLEVKITRSGISYTILMYMSTNLKILCVVQILEVKA